MLTNATTQKIVKKKQLPENNIVSKNTRKQSKTWQRDNTKREYSVLS